MSTEATRTQKVSFDEFRLYYESTEKVTDRRLSANTWNYSICIGMIVAIAGIIKWSAGNNFFYVGLTGIVVLCTMAFFVLLFVAWTNY